MQYYNEVKNIKIGWVVQQKTKKEKKEEKCKCKIENIAAVPELEKKKNVGHQIKKIKREKWE